MTTALATPTALSMPPAIGRHLLFRQTGAHGLVLAILLVAAFVLVRFWPQISAWIADRFRR